LKDKFHVHDLWIAEMFVDPLLLTTAGDFQDLILQFFALRVPLFFMTGFVTGDLEPGRVPFHETGTRHQEDLRRAGVPYFSYRDFVWPVREKPPRLLYKEYWLDTEKTHGLAVRHVGSITHKYIANGLAHALWIVLEKIQSAPPKCNLEAFYKKKRFGRDPTSTQKCLQPVFHMRPVGAELNSAQKFKPTAGFMQRIKTSIWSWRADSGNKYGWIAETNSTNFTENLWSLDFVVALGKEKRVEITYLRTYQNIGVAKFTLVPFVKSQGQWGTSQMWIDGLWNKQVSAPDTVTFYAQSASLFGFADKAFLRITLMPILTGVCQEGSPLTDEELKVLPGKTFKERSFLCNDLKRRHQKFKLLRIISC
jgi:hypothetical protein